MEFNNYVSIGALLISGIALLYTYISNTKKYELQSQYRKEIMEWYKSTINILIKLKRETETPKGNSDFKNDLLCKLSANIEIGRFFFPNETKNVDFGKEKPLAYRGYRNLTLDYLVFSYWLFEKNDASNYLNHAEVLQRYYTSQIFEILDPPNFVKQTQKLTRKSFHKELKYEDFINLEPNFLNTYLDLSKK